MPEATESEPGIQSAEVNIGLTPDEAEKFEEITHAPELQDLTMAGQRQQDMAIDARAKIAAMPDIDLLKIQQGYEQMGESRSRNAWRYADIAKQHGAELQERGLQTIGQAHAEANAENAARDAVAAESKVKPKGKFSLFRRG